MQNTPDIEFNRFIFQNLFKYVPENFVGKGPNKDIPNLSNVSSLFDSSIWSTSKPNLVNKVWPIVVLIGLLEVITGLFLLLTVGFHAKEYDRLFDTEDSRLISNASFLGCVALIISGFVLLFSLLLESKSALRHHILMSGVLCFYTTVIAFVKMYFAMLVIEKGTYDVTQKASKYNIFLSTGCVFGISTLLGAVIHFIGSVTVFSYYKLKYIPEIL